MFEALQYAVLRWFYPQRRDFLSMGFGIAARARRSRRYWLGHLKNCRDVQRKACVSLPQKAVIGVLGAGRLLDVDLTQLACDGGEVHLLDADPGASRAWRSAARALPHTRIVSHLVDLTWSMDEWSDTLQSFLAAHHVNARRGADPAAQAELAAFLDRATLPDSAECAAKLPRCDLLISQNLLSQIPLYWRDRFHAAVLRCWRLDSDEHGRYGDVLQRALERAMARLQMQHLEVLRQSGASRIVIICDRNFFYYRRDVAPWQVHPALYGGLATPLALPGYQLSGQSSWLWHLAPQGIEHAGHGEIHEVWGGIYSVDPSPVAVG